MCLGIRVGEYHCLVGCCRVALEWSESWQTWWSAIRALVSGVISIFTINEVRKREDRDLKSSNPSEDLKVYSKCIRLDPRNRRSHKKTFAWPKTSCYITRNEGYRKSSDSRRVSERFLESVAACLNKDARPGESSS